MFLQDVRLEIRKLCSCSVGCEAWEQEALFLPDVRVRRRKLCTCSVGCEAREQKFC